MVGLSVADSEGLLDALSAQTTRFTTCHEWRVGDVPMWNNLAVLHRRYRFDPNTRRIVHRTRINGQERVA